MFLLYKDCVKLKTKIYKKQISTIDYGYQKEAGIDKKEY